ncbi:MAG: hypothetical protein IMZ66_10675 [Planctomycetes bacterium]|nr:hypothetical protein [Planctomycetota bacterium]
MPETGHDARPPVDPGQRAGEALLGWIVRRKLQAPAAMVLEMHRPLMPLAWSTAMLFGGVVAPLFGPDYYEKIEALRDPALLDRVLKRLETAGGDDGDDRTGTPPGP